MKRTKDLNKKKMRVGTQIKAQKGITLIALVITIIVMLILVAVTISMAINGGLFDYAGKATGETQNTIAKEQEFANLEDNMTVEELIDKYVEKTGVDISLVNIGDYVNYPVAYTNVATYGERCIPENKFENRWRVLSKETDETGNVLHVNLISAGVPLTYYQPYEEGAATQSVENLTTGFLTIEINSSEEESYKFYKCGFNIGNNTNLSSVFANDFTQSVHALTKEEVDLVVGTTTSYAKQVNDEKYAELLAVPCAEDKSYDYARFWLASEMTSLRLWGIEQIGRMTGSGDIDDLVWNASAGVRVVVTLNPNVEFTLADEEINDTTTWDIF